MKTQTSTQDAALANLREESLAQIVSTVNGKPVTRGQLAAAFDKVKDSEHWKNPINKVVDLDVEEVAMVDEAVSFFTGSAAEFVEIAVRPSGKNRYRVRAMGYFLAVGA